MIAIINISPDDAPFFGINRYRVQINDKVVCEFEHFREPDGLAKCLRAAADAVETARAAHRAQLLIYLNELANEGG